MNNLNLFVLASLIALVAITGCQNPINPGQGSTLTVSMNDAVSRSILPGISMVPTSYDLVGAGPNGASFNRVVSTGSSATITELAFGDWTVTATAKNSSGTAIGVGSATVSVLSNASVNVSITVRPYDGFGTLALNVSWPAAQVQTAQIQSSLTPASGTVRNLAFTVNGSAGTASFNANDVATGYHSLVLKLLDNGHLAMGAVEVVRIVKDQTTNGTFAFTNINQATGTLVVNLTPEMADPLNVSITGSAATKPANQSLSLSAAVSNYADNVTYVWYVNGEAVSTGANYSFDDTWAQGFYRIDVTAFTADGKRAGSGTTSTQVMAVMLPSLSSIDAYNSQTAEYQPVSFAKLSALGGFEYFSWQQVQSENPDFYDFTAGYPPSGNYQVALSSESYRFTSSDPSATIEYWIGPYLLASGVGSVSGTQRPPFSVYITNYPGPYLPEGIFPYQFQGKIIITNVSGQTIYIFSCNS